MRNAYESYEQEVLEANPSMAELRQRCNSSRYANAYVNGNTKVLAKLRLVHAKDPGEVLPTTLPMGNAPHMPVSPVILRRTQGSSRGNHVHASDAPHNLCNNAARAHNALDTLKTVLLIIVSVVVHAGCRSARAAIAVRALRVRGRGAWIAARALEYVPVGGSTGGRGNDDGDGTGAPAGVGGVWRVGWGGGTVTVCQW